jgi:WD40 repeat protein
MNLTLSPSHTDYVDALAFSSDHSYLASGSADGYLNLWNANTNWTLMFRLNNGYCGVLIQLPNGQLAAGSGNNINIWDPLNNAAAPIRTLTGHTNTVHGLSLSPDASLLASSSQDTTVKLWNFAGSQTTFFKTLSGHSGEVRALCFLSNQLLVSGSHDTSIKVWNVTSGI